MKKNKNGRVQRVPVLRFSDNVRQGETIITVFVPHVHTTRSRKGEEGTTRQYVAPSEVKPGMLVAFEDGVFGRLQRRPKKFAGFRFSRSRSQPHQLVS